MVFWSVCAGAVLDIILNVILIPVMGAAGASVGTLGAEFTVLVFQLIVLKDKDRMLFRDVRIRKIILAVIFGTALSFWVKMLPFHSLLMLVVSALLFFGAYYAMLMILREPFVKDITVQIRRRITRGNT